MMKRFKFGLVAILLGLFGFISFSNAGSYTFTGTFNGTLGAQEKFIFINVPVINMFSLESFNLNCVFSNVSDLDYQFPVNYNFYYYSNQSKFPNQLTLYSSSNSLKNLSYTINQNYSSYAFQFLLIKHNGASDISISFDWSCTFSGNNIIGGSQSCPECETCPEIDTNYCVENDLCPVSSGVSWSELVINDIVHESAPLINITIPEEYSWDYSVDENEFALDISGQNVDYAYIDGIINTQKGKPNSIDFNNIVSGLIPLLVPGLVIILFIWFIFRFIKKIF